MRLGGKPGEVLSVTLPWDVLPSEARPFETMTKPGQAHNGHSARIRSWPARAACLLALLGGAPAPTVCVACRYTVRDVGFVETTPSLYRLILPADSLPELKRIATAATIQTPIHVEAGSLSGHAEDSEGFVLQAPWGEEFRISAGEDLLRDAAAAQKLLDSLARSPARERLLDLLLEHYAVVALVESENPDLNSQAFEEIEAAVREIEGAMDSMPKAVGAPPVLFPIRAAEFETEKVLAWSLGAGNTPPKVPVAAVVYGRARRLGEPMVGTEIQVERIHRLLSLVGLDCECGLDRKSLEGVALPVRWDDTARKRATRALGFDPDNPMVRMEIDQILTRGPAFGKREGMEGDPLLGYSEQVFLSGSTSPPGAQELEAERSRDTVLEPLGGTDSPLRASDPVRWGLNWTLGLFPVLILAGGLMVFLIGRWREG
ncbi:MAG: hypothetical protein GHCLOJNM_02616 [bacterium]|nr:hypothetical protein [bacterium]